MKILSYNVNGIRAAIKRGFLDWLKYTSPDILCLQEVKATPEQIDESLFSDLGYYTYWMPAQKKGYSGVAILSKEKPKEIEYGCGEQKFDDEGRVIIAKYTDFDIMSLYMPSGTSNDERQAYKMDWLAFFNEYINTYKKEQPNLILSGDYNICNKPIDIHNPISNKNTPGFLPEERQWFDQFLNNGFIDSFRHFNQEPHQYTWWSYRFNAREKNLGWRIDYNLVSASMENRLKRAAILKEAKHSDHCPILLDL